MDQSIINMVNGLYGLIKGTNMVITNCARQNAVFSSYLSLKLINKL